MYECVHSFHLVPAPNNTTFSFHLALVPLALTLFLGIDLIGPLPEADGKWYIATAVCYFTKWVEAKAIPDKNGVEIAWFIYELMLRYGVFSVAISDQGLF